LCVKTEPKPNTHVVVSTGVSKLFANVPAALAVDK
jgi:hypothetical protein